MLQQTYYQPCRLSSSLSTSPPGSKTVGRHSSTAQPCLLNMHAGWAATARTQIGHACRMHLCACARRRRRRRRPKLVAC